MCLLQINFNLKITAFLLLFFFFFFSIIIIIIIFYFIFKNRIAFVLAVLQAKIGNMIIL